METVMRNVLALWAFLFLANLTACNNGDSAHRERYTCPMHANVNMDHPGSCPVCGMSLVPVEDPKDGTPDGLTVSKREADLLGIATTRVEQREMTGVLRVPGKVIKDQGLSAAISEFLLVRRAAAAPTPVPTSTPIPTLTPSPPSTGSTPLPGSPIREVPPGYAAGPPGNRPPWDNFGTRADDLEARLRAAKVRLQAYGVDDSAIPDNLEQPPASFAGDRGSWVQAELFDFETTIVQAGQEVEITSPAVPNRVFHGRVALVDSEFGTSRSLRVRVIILDPDKPLRPEMRVNANIKVSAGKRLAVPSSAVLDTGRQQFAYVSGSDGRIQRREVSVGITLDGWREVSSGLEEGSEVISWAHFMIDSESVLRSESHDH